MTSTPEAAQKELDRGARMVTCVNDHFLLAYGMQNAYRDFAHIGIREGAVMDRNSNQQAVTDHPQPLATELM